MVRMANPWNNIQFGVPNDPQEAQDCPEEDRGQGQDAVVSQNHVPKIDSPRLIDRIDAATTQLAGVWIDRPIGARIHVGFFMRRRPAADRRLLTSCSSSALRAEAARRAKNQAAVGRGRCHSKAAPANTRSEVAGSSMVAVKPKQSPARTKYLASRRGSRPIRAIAYRPKKAQKAAGTWLFKLTMYAVRYVPNAADTRAYMRTQSSSWQRSSVRTNRYKNNANGIK